jgi:predicted DNA-binding transcriptional regulator AlpA
MKSTNKQSKPVRRKSKRKPDRLLPRGLISYEELRPLYGIRLSRMQLRRKMQVGTFPQAVKDGHCISWIDTELADYIAKLMAARAGQ